MCDLSQKIGRATAASAQVSHGHTNPICAGRSGHPAPHVQKLLFHMPCNCKSTGKAMSHMLSMQCMGFKHVVEEILPLLGHRATLAAAALPGKPFQTDAQSLDLAYMGLEVALKDVVLQALRREGPSQTSSHSLCFQHLIRPRRESFWGHRLRNEARDGH